MMNRALILLSGGLDSAVNLAHASSRHMELTTLTFHYGQRAAFKELKASEKLSEYYHAKRLVLDLPWLAEITKTALVGKTPLPQLQLHELDDPVKTKDSAKDVWVPNRNGVFLNIAAAMAEAWEIPFIYVGFNKEEATTFPDNTKEYADVMNQAFSYSTFIPIKILSVTLELTKLEIIRLGRSMNLPFDLIWSCYEGGDTPCQQCESCLRFSRAMEKAL